MGLCPELNRLVNEYMHDVGLNIACEPRQTIAVVIILWL